MTKEMHLSREQAEEFYSEHKDKDFFESLMTHMSRCVCVCVPMVWCVSVRVQVCTYMQLCENDNTHSCPMNGILINMSKDCH